MIICMEYIKEDLGQFQHVRRSPRCTWVWLVVGVLGSMIIGLIWFFYALLPPATFSTMDQLHVSAGSDLHTIAVDLRSAGYIRSVPAFMIVAVVRGEAGNLKAGTYTFQYPYSTPELVTRLAAGDFFNDLVRVTHVEGWSVRRLAFMAESALIDFDSAEFIEIANMYEGQLYPDTYYVPGDFSPKDLRDLLHAEYLTQMEQLQLQIDQHPLTEYEIITLASILEREANTITSKRTVSGILQNRLAIQMPLQADATMEYVLDKPLSELTAADLEIDSPYNTYLNRGLPPTPIGNPGMTAIMAVLEPVETDYFYYITGRDGEFYYAEDFDTHRQNIDRYLRM